MSRNALDAIRYALALFLVVTLPPLLFFWPLIHQFVRFWRKVGPAATYSLLGALFATLGCGLFRIRGVLLAVDFGTSWPLLALGTSALASATWLRLRLHRHVTNRVLAGLPELAPDRYPTKLVTEGLYTRVRHPRYVQFALALLGYALIANYLAVYLIFLAWIPAIWIVAVLEEGELRDRFGKEYEEYCRHVPRFLPRFRPRGR
jgi:protein-S-isoprenylcysteine O-methyltransferase Ste14